MAIATNSYKENCAKWHLAGRQHGRIAAQIGGCLGAFVATNGLGETYAAGTGFIIDTVPDTVRAPDVSFVARERAEADRRRTRFFPRCTRPRR